MVERVGLGGLTRRERPAVGLRPALRFAIALSLTVAYVAVCVYISQPWRANLEEALGPVLSWAIPITLAYIPGFVIAFLASTLSLTRYHLPEPGAPDGPWPRGEWPPVTVLVAARNEEDEMARTLEHVAALDYPGEVEIVLADNGSSDRTAERASETAARLGLAYRCVPEPRPGKFRALNAALAEVTTPLVVTVDADTHPHRDALRYLVARVSSRPQGQRTCACAGALVVENAGASFLTGMQAWDYRLGMNGVKRLQAAYNTALVAQGAFSAYWTEDLRAVGGWPDAIGEDIVLTWALLGSRGIVQYEPVAVAFTTVPTTVRPFMRQRSRWARGMLEGLRSHPPYRQPRVLAKFVAGIDYLVPFLDAGYVFFWLPGFVLFLFGYPLIVGWWSMLFIPASLVVFGLLRRWQERHVLDPLGIRSARNRGGFVGYLLAYQVLLSTSSLHGYAQFALRRQRRWE